MTDQQKKFRGPWLFSTVEMMSKCWKLMHDPQDNCFTSKFSAFQGNQGDSAWTHLPPFAMVGYGLTLKIVIKATATRRGENNVS